MIYKTWEVMKMLAENPTLKFKNLSFNYGKEAYLSVDSDDAYAFFYSNVNTDSSINKMTIEIGDEWELINSEVNFTTAIKAHNEGKTIYCIIGNEKFTYEATLSTVLRDDEGLAISSDEIVKGKWYIVQSV